MEAIVISRTHEEGDFRNQPFSCRYEFSHLQQSLSVRLDIFAAGCDIREREQYFQHPAPPFCRMFCFMAGPTGTIKIDGETHRFAAETVYILNAEHPFEVTYEKGSCLIFAHFKLSDPSCRSVFDSHPGWLTLEDASAASNLRRAFAANNRFLSGNALAYVIGQRLAAELDLLASRYHLYRSFAPMLELINRSPAGALRVAELADAMGMSANYLSKHFKRRTGSSLKQYLQQLYLQKAAELLLHTDLSTGEIAAALGHDDAHYFYHAFKKLTGLSPGEYRSLS